MRGRFAEIALMKFTTMDTATVTICPMFVAIPVRIPVMSCIPASTKNGTSVTIAFTKLMMRIKPVEISCGAMI